MARRGVFPNEGVCCCLMLVQVSEEREGNAGKVQRKE